MSASFPVGLAYCGPPPGPTAILSHWRLDPVVLAVLVAWWAAYVVGCRRLAADAPPLRSRVAFHSGWLIATLALVSPLCPLSVSLFSARAAQHVILTLFAAPLIAAAEPLRTMFAAWPGAPGSRSAALADLERRITRTPLAATAAFAITVWIWHMPAPYASTFLSWSLYWLMHVTMFASAWWLWANLLRGAHELVFSGIVAGIVSSVQMGLLGALITLSPRAFYVPHFTTTEAWGFTPLQDQELGGVIMWVPGCTVFLVVAMIALARCLKPADARASFARSVRSAP